MNLPDVSAALAAQRDERLEQLRELVAMPSVSADPDREGDVRATAEHVVGVMTEAGLSGSRLLDMPVGPPAVYAECLDAGPDAPTVLFYAHYDVQPPFDRSAWPRDPFNPVVEGGRLFGRGSADDKHGVVSIAWAVNALRQLGALGVNVKVLSEGEEEVGSPNLGALLSTHGDLLRADTYVIDDAVNEKAGEPLLTATLRGLVGWEVTVRAMQGSGQHSGLFGGVIPDPRMALSILLAGLVDEHGAVTVPGLRDGIVVPSLVSKRMAGETYDEAAMRRAVRLLDEVALAGDPEVHPYARLWLEPALTVIGIDGPSVAESSNTIAASARAKLSLRIGPGQDPAHIDRAMRTHLEAQRPLGLPVSVEGDEAARPFVLDEEHPSVARALEAMETAYGVPPAVAGVGGTIPMIAPLQEAAPEAGFILMGCADPTSNIHGINESLDLQDWERNTLALALLLTA